MDKLEDLIVKTAKIPRLTEQEINEGLLSANNSTRRRHPKLLHHPGDEFNRVFNFNMQDSYMQPHLHPGVEKIEEIYVVQGRIAVLFFDDQGAIINMTLLEEGGTEYVKVPAFTWHTYVMLSEHAISYETMMGKYDPKTWKKFAKWAPAENFLKSAEYLDYLRNEIKRMIRILA